MISDIKQDKIIGNILVIYSVHVLGTDSLEQGNFLNLLKKYKITLYSINENLNSDKCDNKLSYTMFSGISEYNRDILSQNYLILSGINNIHVTKYLKQEIITVTEYNNLKKLYDYIKENCIQDDWIIIQKLHNLSNKFVYNCSEGKTILDEFQNILDKFIAVFEL